MMEWLTDPHAWASFVALSAMEIVLGIDNLVFLGVMVAKMPARQRLMARRIGLSLALIFRVIMLGGIAWMIHLTTPIFSVGGYDFSWRDLVLIAGGLFLLVKGTREIHDDIEGEEELIRRRRCGQFDDLGDRADRRHRSRLFHRFDHYRCRHGRSYRGDDRRRRARDPRDVFRLRARRALYRATPDHQDARAVIPVADRRCADRRRLPLPYPARLPLLRHGVLRWRRSGERACARRRRRKAAAAKARKK